MTSGFVAHGDDRVTAVLLQPDSLLDGGSRGNDLGSGSLDPIQQRVLWQAEMKADDLGFQRFNQRATGVIEGRTCGHRRGRFEVSAQFGVIVFECIFPVSLSGRVGSGWLVAKEIQVQRGVGILADQCHFFADLIQGQRGAGQGCQPPGVGDGNRHG